MAPQPQQAQVSSGGFPLFSGMLGLTYLFLVVKILNAFGFGIFFSVFLAVSTASTAFIKETKTRLAALTAIGIVAAPSFIDKRDEIFYAYEDNPMLYLTTLGAASCAYATGKVARYESRGEIYYEAKEAYETRLELFRLRENLDLEVKRTEARTTALIEYERALVQEQVRKLIQQNVPLSSQAYFHNQLGLPAQPALPTGRPNGQQGSPTPQDAADWNDVIVEANTPETPENNKPAPRARFVEAVSACIECFDLAQYLEATDRHIWLVAVTRSGKTFFEYAILTHAFDRWKGRAQAVIADIKGSSFNKDLGISDYYYSNDVEDMPMHVNQIRKVIKVLDARQDERVKRGGDWGNKKPPPIFMVIPEFNSFVNNLKQYDGIHPVPKKDGRPIGRSLSSEAGAMILRIVTQGLEDNVRLIVDAQTGRMENFKFDSNTKFDIGLRNNLAMAGLARNSDYAGIRDFIQYCVSSSTKKECNETIDNYDKNQMDKDVPVAITNYGGSNRVVQTPKVIKENCLREWKGLTVVADRNHNGIDDATEDLSEQPELDEDIEDENELYAAMASMLPINADDASILKCYENLTEDKLPSDQKEIADLLRLLRNEVKKIQIRKLQSQS